MAIGYKIIIMMYFGNRRPRGFHHTFRFSDERRDILDSLRRGVLPELLAERSLEGANEEKSHSRRAPNRGMSAMAIIVAILAVLVAALMAISVV